MQTWRRRVFALVVALALGCGQGAESPVARSLQSLIEADQVASALDLAERYLQEHPDDPAVQYWRFVALLKMERLPAATRALAEMADSAGALERAFRSSDDMVRVAAMRLVAETGMVVDRAWLMRGLNDPVSAMRRYSVKALGKARDRSALRRLFALCRDEDWSVRAEVADAFARIGDERAVGWLIWLLNDSDGYVRHRAEVALLELVTEQHRAFLERRLAGGGLLQQLPIAAALLRLNASAGERVFEEAVKHPEAMVRLRTARLLSALGEPRFTNWLYRLKHDVDPQVREQAARGLEQLAASPSRPFVAPLADWNSP